jgi:hypothetical protein
MEYRFFLLGEVPFLPKHAVTFWGSPGTFFVCLRGFSMATLFMYSGA